MFLLGTLCGCGGRNPGGREGDEVPERVFAGLTPRCDKLLVDEPTPAVAMSGSAAQTAAPAIPEAVAEERILEGDASDGSDAGELAVVGRLSSARRHEEQEGAMDAVRVARLELEQILEEQRRAEEECEQASLRGANTELAHLLQHRRQLVEEQGMQFVSPR
mmetsp:Transcript_24972/g.78719  ORF Transcript_24972/g.78719 Transcript_24972/m.78719 type:complete len:162 (+) Transcript_24972:59-544(+)